MLQIQFFLPLACLLAFAAGRVAAAPATGRLVVNIVEAQTSKPVACNVYLTANGKAIFAPNCPRWERDGSFACDGRFAVEAPAEKIEMTVERGPEWESCALTLECEAGTTKTFTVALTRWIDMNARGWFSGDLHVHRPVEDMP
ncbi:hypothetical protein FJY63_08240, partial [Candidatus Sumerlaeota bacterium]|nr:hypothetical protein [Candidatus Sumerlaeota bacterium]